MKKKYEKRNIEDKKKINRKNLIYKFFFHN